MLDREAQPHTCKLACGLASGHAANTLQSLTPAEIMVLPEVTVSMMVDV